MKDIYIYFFTWSSKLRLPFPASPPFFPATQFRDPNPRPKFNDNSIRRMIRLAKVQRPVPGHYKLPISFDLIVVKKDPISQNGERTVVKRAVIFEERAMTVRTYLSISLSLDTQLDLDLVMLNNTVITDYLDCTPCYLFCFLYNYLNGRSD